jgi:hypothetical protein
VGGFWNLAHSRTAPHTIPRARTPDVAYTRSIDGNSNTELRFASLYRGGAGGPVIARMIRSRSTAPPIAISQVPRSKK